MQAEDARLITPPLEQSVGTGNTEIEPGSAAIGTQPRELALCGLAK
jgi:hypothetical protein